MSEKTTIISKGVQDELGRFMKLHDIKSLEEVLNILPEDLLKMDGCGMRLAIEVYRIKDSDKDHLVIKKD